jgi:TRAP-type C4-dicarboxylate transport system permease small subunit
VALVALMMVPVMNMVLRQVARPWSATVELVGWFSAMTLAFALGYSQSRKAHLAIDIATVRLPKALRKAVIAVMLVLSLALFTFVGIELMRHALSVLEDGSVSNGLRISFAPFIFAVALGFLVFSFQLLVDVTRSFRGEEVRGGDHA